jgi:hypothetical protein
VRGYPTSYVDLFDDKKHQGSPNVKRVTIPLIQRDYAQGRLSPEVEEIRTNFLTTLLDAVAGGPPVGLDFVYGEVDDATFRPLDGQQRLTTLFLLHWYVASTAGILEPHAPWTKFTYETRASARLFCERLAEHPLPAEVTGPSDWIVDQPWYLYVWRSDPTVQSMLTVLDAIHGHIHISYPDLDHQQAWARLTDSDSPAVSFYLLPLDDMESGEDLYIKMNSRGKPLTPFETFKARFEQDIVNSARATEFAHKIDGPWADLLWPYNGGDNLVDDEFIRYIDYLTEICEFRDNRAGTDRLGPRARAVYAGPNSRSEEHLDLLFSAFDVWDDAEHVNDTFSRIFSTSEPGDIDYDVDKVLLFGATTTNLFSSCLRDFDSQREGNRPFRLQQSLLLYAVLLHMIHAIDDINPRARVLRNLISASEDEIRRQNMQALLEDVEHLILRDDLDSLRAFNSNQIVDEQRKRKFSTAHPEFVAALHRLEDHRILRGTLAVFHLHSGTIRQRAEAFESVFNHPAHWLDLTGALLCAGEYQRRRPGSAAWQFGASSQVNEGNWRYLMTNASWEGLTPTRDVLGPFLDEVASVAMPLDEVFKGIIRDWLSCREEAQLFDWRYYLVKYPEMRGGATGIYYGEGGELGYSLCMLRKTQMNSLYRDPVLLGLWKRSGLGERIQNPWFTGYSSNARWLRLERSAVGLRSVQEGFAVSAPELEEALPVFRAVCARHGVEEAADGKLMLRIPQAEDGEDVIDTTDRIALGVRFVKDLVSAGL